MCCFINSRSSQGMITPLICISQVVCRLQCHAVRIIITHAIIAVCYLLGRERVGFQIIIVNTVTCRKSQTRQNIELQIHTGIYDVCNGFARLFF